MKYQTDYEGYIKNDGCLLCSIVTICEEITGCEMSKPHFEDFVKRLNTEYTTSYNSKLSILSYEHDPCLPGSYVWDHEALFNKTFEELGTYRKMRYTGCIYMPWEIERGRVSFGVRGGDYLILQIKTSNGGHFRLPNFDPWKQGTKMVDLKSLRFYTLV